MTSRRSFLQTSAAAISAMTLLRQSLAGQSGTRTLGVVVFDERIGISQQFATEAQRLGADALPIRGDLSEASFRTLRMQLQQRATLIAGLTLEPAVASIHSLAREAQYQVLYRAEHVIDELNVHHHIESDRSTAGLAAQLPESAAELGSAAARLASLIDEQSSLQDKVIKSHGLSTFNDDENRLVSWVIGPLYS